MGILQDISIFIPLPHGNGVNVRKAFCKTDIVVCKYI